VLVFAQLFFVKEIALKIFDFLSFSNGLTACPSPAWADSPEIGRQKPAIYRAY